MAVSNPPPDSLARSTALFARAQNLIPGGVNSPVRAFRSVGGAPFFVKAARGATLITADDRELIDFVCTWGPAIHGHNHPVIKSAIARALDHGTSFGTPNPYEVEMAELKQKLSQMEEMEKELEHYRRQAQEAQAKKGSGLWGYIAG